MYKNLPKFIFFTHYIRAPYTAGSLFWRRGFARTHLRGVCGGCRPNIGVNGDLTGVSTAGGSPQASRTVPSVTGA